MCIEGKGAITDFIFARRSRDGYVQSLCMCMYLYMCIIIMKEPYYKIANSETNRSRLINVLFIM